MPTTEVDVVDRPFIVFDVMVTAVPTFELVMPVTAPPVPDDVNPVTVFELTFKTVGAVPEEPAKIPTIEPVPVIFEIVLLDTLFVPGPK
jgi:hypothetical protein